MSLPEVRMSFPDRAALERELDQNLKHGRAFLTQTTDLPVLSECMLVIVHPDHGTELHLPAQVVMVNASGPMCGIGLALRGCSAEDMLRLQDFAVANETTSGASAPCTVEATGPGGLSETRATVRPIGTSAPPLVHQTYVPPPPAAVDASAPPPVPNDASAPPLAQNTYVPPAPDVSSAPPLAQTTYVPPAPSTSASSAPAPDQQSLAAITQETRTSAAPSARTSPAPAAEAATRGTVAAPHAEAAQPDASAGGGSVTEIDPELPLEQESELSVDDAAEASAGHDAEHAANTELQAGSKQDRLRHLTAAQQLKVARTGELSDRVTVERLYGKQVWEALLQNPRISLPEVSRIARKGTVPKPLLDQILDNGAWVKNDAVRRALLSNPKLGSDAIMKLLRLTPKHELKTIDKGTAYGHAVREAARKLLKQ